MGSHVGAGPGDVDDVLRFKFWQPDGETPSIPAAPAPRGPRVALALGAGAARGWAQIGVLRELSGRGLAPDVVVGTSMGAVVGGCFCAGRLDHLEQFARALTKRRVFSLLDLTMSGSGLLAGRKLQAALLRDLGHTAIEALPIRFAAVATQAPRLALRPRSRPTIAQVLVDAFNITQDRIARSRLAGDPPDLTINVRVGGIGLFDFHRAADLIGIGRDAAERALPDLAQLLPSHGDRAGTAPD